jgi:hypothetical protein
MAETLGELFWIPVFASLSQQSFCVNPTMKGALSSPAIGRRIKKPVQSNPWERRFGG